MQNRAPTNLRVAAWGRFRTFANVSFRPEAVIRATLDRGRQGDRRCLPVRKGETKWRPYGVGRARAATDANFRPPDIVCAELRHEMIGCCPDVA